ncbi:hypothetical protein QTP88_019638 [Uroleucon formosanum]
MVSKCIDELNIVEINRELHKRGIDTGGSKVDRLLILEEFIRTKEQIDPRSLRFEVTSKSRGNTSKTGIRWVTMLAPQLKAQAGAWRGTMRTLDLPWQKFKFELLERFNGDELQSSLQSELLNTAQTKTETLGE